MKFQTPKLHADNGSKAFRVMEMALPITGIVPPAENALYFGQRYVDTVAKKEYTATAVGSEVPADDWQEVTLV